MRAQAVLAAVLIGLAAPAARAEAEERIRADAHACRLDLREAGTGVVLAAWRDGSMSADVHAPGSHLPGDAHLWWGFNLYNDFAPSVPADGFTRVRLDRERIEALVGVASVSFALTGGQEVELGLFDAPRVVAALEACAAVPLGSDWAANLAPPSPTPWRVVVGPGFLTCAYAAPIAGGGVFGIARTAHALGAFVSVARDGLPAGRVPAWFVFAGGWALETQMESADGVATAGFYAENEIGVGLSTFTRVIVVVGDLVVPLDLPPASREARSEMERCLAGMERWR